MGRGALISHQHETHVIEILHRDEHLVAVNKPAGLAVHRSWYVGPSDDYLVDAVARAIPEQPLFLAHRLDRATSGVTLFATSSEVAAALGAQFMSRAVAKRYLAVCRGWPPEHGTIEHALDTPTSEERKPAVTHYTRIAMAEVPLPLGRYEVQRYSLVEARPESGRHHQIRRHFKHASHHLIGDTTHGRGEHNRVFRERWGVQRLLLHARSIAFAHPASGVPMEITAPLDAPWERVLAELGWSEALKMFETHVRG